MGQLGGLSPQASIAVGIFVGLLSTSIQSLGLTLQRKSHLLEDEIVEREIRRPPYKRRRWQLGMGMFILSNLVGSTIQITTLPLPVLSTLQASGLVFNTAFATLFLQEPFTRFSLIGTLLTCTGASLIAVFGAIGEPAHTLQQLLELLVRPQFLIWMAATFIIVIGTLILARFLKYWSSRVHESHPRSRREQSPSASLSKGRRRSSPIPLPRAAQLRTSRLKLLCGLAYALVSGILSAHSLLVAKSAVELLVRTVVDHANQFRSYQSWLILLSLLFFALTQLYYLHQGLRLCSTSVLYPFVFCIYNIIAILDGLIYFHQTSRLSILHGCLIAVGTVVLLSGVLALSWRLDDAAPAEPQATPLAPGLGLGLVSPASGDLDDSPKSSFLPKSPRRGSTSKRTSDLPSDESTPLLYHPRSSGRRARFTVHPPPPETGNAQRIWAELDDSDETDRDVLASLPKSTSPFLSSAGLKPQRKHVGSQPGGSPETCTGSNMLWGGPLRGKSDSSKDGDDGVQRTTVHHKPPRRSQTLKERTYKERRRSSAPSSGERPVSSASATVSKTGSPGNTVTPSTMTATSRPRGLSSISTPSVVQRRGYRDRLRGRARSAGETPTVVPSRWDMSGSVARWWQGQSAGKEDAEQDHGGGGENSRNDDDDDG